MSSHITIDNLGFNASQRYALDQQMLGETGRLTQDSHVVSGKIRVDVTTPSFQSECDSLLTGNQKNTSWAIFTPPADFEKQTRTSFTFELLPSLMLREKKDHYFQKIEEHCLGQEDSPGEKEESDDKEKERLRAQKKLAQEEKERKKNAILHLVNCILSVNQDMIYTNIKRSQYHKG